MLNPFKQPGQWYRGNTHAHSTVSDGMLTMAERFAAYRQQGYHFLVLTDHGQVSDVSAYSDADFLAISGAELHPKNRHSPATDVYHIVALDIHAPIDAPRMEPPAVVAAIHEQGGVAVIGHPHWLGHNFIELEALRGSLAVEVYNDTCQYENGKGFSESIWDDLLDAWGPIHGIAADDAHDSVHDCFHGWIMVKAAELTVPAIMQAIRAGSFYSTLGPDILDLVCDPGLDGGRPARVAIKCSPAKSISFKCSRNRGKHVVAPERALLTDAEYVLESDALKYLRVEITDAIGRKAWTNALYWG